MVCFGLYIHIPFCPYKCNYCDFLTFSKVDKKIDEYMLYLNKEIELYRGKGYSLDSIFIGGGTPSYIDSSYILELMDHVRDVFSLTDDCEISIEMNPNTLDESKVRDYLKAGINRYSLGVQTFNDGILKVLGRSHSKEIVLRDIKMLRNLGVKNLSVDMMLANPNQDMKVLEEDLDLIAGLEIDHISYYSLILEERTLFMHWLKEGKIELFDDDLERRMFARVKERLSEFGFNRYEISNFAKQGKMSRHNMKYWLQEPYLAVGLGSSANTGHVRTKNFSKFGPYYEAIDQGDFPIESSEDLSVEDLEKEYIIMAMRMIDGFSIDEINKKFKIDFLRKYESIIEKHKAYGALEIKEGRIRFTDYGLDVSNQFYVDII